MYLCRKAALALMLVNGAIIEGNGLSIKLQMQRKGILSCFRRGGGKPRIEKMAAIQKRQDEFKEKSMQEKACQFRDFVRQTVRTHLKSESRYIIDSINQKVNSQCDLTDEEKALVKVYMLEDAVIEAVQKFPDLADNFVDRITEKYMFESPNEIPFEVFAPFRGYVLTIKDMIKVLVKYPEASLDDYLAMENDKENRDVPGLLAYFLANNISTFDDFHRLHTGNVDVAHRLFRSGDRLRLYKRCGGKHHAEIGFKVLKIFQAWTVTHKALCRKGFEKDSETVGVVPVVVPVDATVHVNAVKVLEDETVRVRFAVDDLQDGAWMTYRRRADADGEDNADAWKTFLEPAFLKPV